MSTKSNGHVAVIDPLRTYSVREACRWLGWGRRAVYKATRTGRLPVITGGIGYRYLGQHLLDLAQPLPVSGAEKTL